MRRAALLALALAAGCAAPTRPVSDWERDHRDLLARAEQAPVALPAYPKKADLIEFYVSATTDFKYFVDASTINVLPRQREVRYVMVARSPSGAENVFYEAIHCPDEYRVLAVGQPGGRWSGEPSDWRPIQKGTALGWTYALARNFFCPHRDSIQTAAEGVDALRRGVHPAVYVEKLR